MSYTKLRNILEQNKKYVIPATVLTACFILHITTRFSSSLSDFLTFGISHYIRASLSFITSFVPFSLGETVIIMLPVLLALVIYIAIKGLHHDSKIIHVLIVILTVMYSMFVLSFAPSYSTSTADRLFDIQAGSVSADELYKSALILSGEINELADDISFKYGSNSVMPYDMDALSDKLVSSYSALGQKYPFVRNYRSRLKPIALSKPMTYTHISGVYTYYTGETNINTNFPDYTIPYTSAHEMAHGRGFAREKEANFVAFLACSASDDPYIRYSGKLSMLEYITNALYTADPDLYREVFYSLDIRVRCELVSYSEFFDDYRDSAASEISSTVNDVYLKSQGQSEGEKSYGLVVDLAVAYILDNRS